VHEGRKWVKVSERVLSWSMPILLVRPAKYYLPFVKEKLITNEQRKKFWWYVTL
jgi:hypothetical protein